MEKFDKSFEEQLRDKLEGHEFNYEPQAWTKMQGMLHQQEKKHWRKYALLGLRLSAAVITGGLLMLSGWYLRDISVSRNSNSAGSYTASDKIINNGSANPNASLGKQGPSSVFSAEHKLASSNERSSFSPEASMNTSALNRSRNGIKTNGSLRNGLHKKHYPAASESFNAPAKEAADKESQNQTALNAENANTSAAADLLSGNESGVSLLPGLSMLALNNSENMKSLKTIHPRKPLEHHHKPMYMTFAAEAGFNLDMAKYVNGDFSPVLGALAQLHLNRKASWETGIVFEGQSGKNISYKSIEVNYGLSRDSSVMLATLDKMFWMTVPFRYSYKLTDKTTIFSGLQFSTLLTGKVLTQYSYYDGEKLDSFHTSKMEASSLPGIKRFDFSVPFGLELKMSKKMGMAISYQVGLGDISDNKFFNEALRHSTSVFQARLVYHI